MNQWRCNVAAGVLAVLTTLAVGAPPPASAQEFTAAEIAGMKADYKRPAPRPAENQALVDIGRLLFWDPRVSASGKTACVTCHLPNLGWSVNDPKSRNDSGKLTSRKSPTLLAVGYMASDVPNGWDGRNRTLEAQITASIATGSMSMRETDTPVKVEVIEERIRAVPDYVERFKALADTPINLQSIAKAIAAYERTMEPGPAPFDRWIEGDEKAISDSAKRGFVLYNTKGLCFACHTGWRFTDDKFHDIGTTTTDLGRGRELKTDPDMQYAFKTPTLRSVALRAPYMHNASSKTLDEVMRHYEKGGIDRPSRSPLMMPVELNDTERRDLVAFMETLTGAPEGEPAPKLPTNP
ncbi:MAG TPA: cytochrome c peroxidase [Pseudorhodoplanes sp.]|nr:cytochrome c peroxidase [Pseudorhodoplanes sp.]